MSFSHCSTRGRSSPCVRSTAVISRTVPAPIVAILDLIPLAAQQVAAPLIAECFANIECKVADTALVGAYNLFVLEPVRAWVDPSQPHPQMFHHRGDGTFTLDGETIDLKDHMTKWQYLL